MTIFMKFTAFVVSLVFTAIGATAQDVTTILAGNTGIAEGGKNDFCYYGGLAYSPNSYLTVRIPTQERVAVAGAGGQSVEAEGAYVQYILLQCVDAEAVGRNECSSDGLAWAVRKNAAISPRVEQ